MTASARSSIGGRPLRARARATTTAVAGGFRQHDLLTYASAISFQILTAMVPFLLFVLAVAGLLHEHGVWRNHLAPAVRGNVPPAMFTVIEDAVTTLFARRAVLWATLGGGLALWQVSGAVRAVMGALARIYEAPGERPFLRRYTISLALSVEVGAIFILAAACLLFAPFFWTAHRDLGSELVTGLLRWTLFVGLLFIVVALLIRHAPGRAQTVPWVSLGATIVTASWLIASLIFDLYLNDVASYQSVFGSLAVVIVTFGYLYLSTIAFLFGALLDAIIRAGATGSPAGVEP